MPLVPLPDNRGWYVLGAVGVAGLVAWWWSSSSTPAQAPQQMGAAMPEPAPGQPGAAPSPLAFPALPFPVDALVPIVSERTVKAHHEVHQKKYVEGVNRDLAQLHSVRQQAYPPEARRPMRRSLARSLAYNLGGAYLHDLYWRSLSPPGGGGAPSPQLTTQIQRDFGSLGMLAQELTDVGMAMEGSGWALLAWSPYLQRLIVLSVGDHDNGIPPGVAPLLPLDVWEHAYYLDHGPDRGAYLRQFWGILNWSELSRRFAAATGQRLPAAAPVSPGSEQRTPRQARPTAAPSPAPESPPEDEEEDEEDVLGAERRRMQRKSAKIRAKRRKEHREAMERQRARSQAA